MGRARFCPISLMVSQLFYDDLQKLPVSACPGDLSGADLFTAGGGKPHDRGGKADTCAPTGAGAGAACTGAPGHAGGTGAPDMGAGGGTSAIARISRGPAAVGATGQRHAR